MNSLRIPCALWAVVFAIPCWSPRAADPPPGEPGLLLKAGSVWRYSNDGRDQGTAWRAPDFDASSWRSGPAQLGYGDGDEATVTRDGKPPHPLTAYFRAEFQIDATDPARHLLLRLVRDDGAVIYLNGRELLRDNMPAGEIGFGTPAAATAGEENAWRTFETDAALLVAGRNVLAVEVHQANAESSDLSFDLELIGHPTVVALPVVSIRAPNAVTSEPLPTEPMPPGILRIVRTGSVVTELPVWLHYEGTATPGKDYEALPTALAIPAGKEAVELKVVALADDVVEGVETVVAKLEPDPSMGPIERYRVAPDQAEAKVVIHDNAPPLEGPKIQVTMPLDGSQFAPAEVVRIEAVAVDPKGFIAWLEYFANETKIGESFVGWPECVGCEPKPGDPAHHVFEWKGAAPGQYRLVARATQRLVFVPHYAEQKIEPPAVSSPVNLVVRNGPSFARLGIVATRPVAEESSFPYRRLPLTGEFTISRTGDLTLPARVFVLYGGEAENGVDCEAIPWMVTIPAGEKAVSLEVKAIPDKALEGSESFIATLSPCPPRTEPPLGIPCVAVEIDPDRESAVVTICDDARCGQAATLQITTPSSGSQFPVGEPIPIRAVAVDPLGAITRAEFWADDQQIGVSEIWFIRPPDPGTPIHHEFVWKDASPGSHTLTVRAQDSAGLNVMSPPIPVLVGQPEPVRVALVKPLGGAVFGPDETIEIRAVASAAQGAIAQLEIYADALLLGSATQTELSVRWEKAPLGPHVLIARAYSVEGLAVVSSPVRILVRESPEQRFVQRQLPPAFLPGVAFEVKLVATPSRLGSAWAVADRPPPGWPASSPSDDGVFDSDQGVVRFGPYTDVTARTLTYWVTPPDDAQGRHEFVGHAALDGTVVPVGGDRIIGPSVQAHPADLDPADMRISLAEVTAYAAAWKEGRTWPAGPAPIPLNYMTRAGEIWRLGEAYVFQCGPEGGTPPDCWVPGKLAAPGAHLLASHHVVRSLGGPALPGGVVEVQIAVTPDPSVSAFALEEQLPPGWTLVSTDAGANYDSVRQQIRWGPFFSPEPRRLTYRVAAPANLASFAPLVGSASFDGRDQPILGVRSVVAQDAATAVVFHGIRRGADGVRIEVGGIPGQLCQIEASADLINWVPHHQVFVLENGRVEFDDDPAPTQARFFRVRPATSP